MNVVSRIIADSADSGGSPVSESSGSASIASQTAIRPGRSGGAFFWLRINCTKEAGIPGMVSRFFPIVRLKTNGPASTN